MSGELTETILVLGLLAIIGIAIWYFISENDNEKKERRKRYDDDDDFWIPPDDYE